MRGAKIGPARLKDSLGCVAADCAFYILKGEGAQRSEGHDNIPLSGADCSWVKVVRFTVRFTSIGRKKNTKKGRGGGGGRGNTYGALRVISGRRGVRYVGEGAV